MAMDGQKCGRMDRMDCQTDGRTDALTTPKLYPPTLPGQGVIKKLDGD